MESTPLILTLTLNEEASDFFTQQRTTYFPPERNYLQAHLTLFHHLPHVENDIIDALTEISKHQNDMDLQVTDLMSLGYGVAYKIKSQELLDLHQYLQTQWEPFLKAQDKQKLRPHITIQNKVTPEVARETEKELKETFSPFQIKGTGFSLWEYLGGPWKLYHQFPFLGE